MPELDKSTGELNGEPFSQKIATMGKGQIDYVMTDVLRELTLAVVQTNTKGSLTLKLEIKPDGLGDYAVVVPSYTVKAPHDDLPSQPYYIAGDGELLRNDPTQRKLDLAPVDGKPHQMEKVT